MGRKARQLARAAASFKDEEDPEQQAQGQGNPPTPAVAAASGGNEANATVAVATTEVKRVETRSVEVQVDLPILAAAATANEPMQISIIVVENTNNPNRPIEIAEAVVANTNNPEAGQVDLSASNAKSEEMAHAQTENQTDLSVQAETESNEQIQSEVAKIQENPSASVEPMELFDENPSNGNAEASAVKLTKKQRRRLRKAEESKAESNEEPRVESAGAVVVDEQATESDEPTNKTKPKRKSKSKAKANANGSTSEPQPLTKREKRRLRELEVSNLVQMINLGTAAAAAEPQERVIPIQATAPESKPIVSKVSKREQAIANIKNSEPDSHAYTDSLESKFVIDRKLILRPFGFFYTPLTVIKQLSRDSGKPLLIRITTPNAPGANPLYYVELYFGRFRGQGECVRSYVAIMMAAADMLETISQHCDTHPNHYFIPHYGVPPGFRINPRIYNDLLEFCNEHGLEAPVYTCLPPATGAMFPPTFIFKCRVGNLVKYAIGDVAFMVKRIVAKKMYELLSDSKVPLDRVCRGEDCKAVIRFGIRGELPGHKSTWPSKGFRQVDTAPGPEIDGVRSFHPLSQSEIEKLLKQKSKKGTKLVSSSSGSGPEIPPSVFLKPPKDESIQRFQDANDFVEPEDVLSAKEEDLEQSLAFRAELKAKLENLGFWKDAPYAMAHGEVKLEDAISDCKPVVQKQERSENSDTGAFIQHRDMADFIQDISESPVWKAALQNATNDWEHVFACRRDMDASGKPVGVIQIPYMSNGKKHYVGVAVEKDPTTGFSRVTGIETPPETVENPVKLTDIYLDDLNAEIDSQIKSLLKSRCQELGQAQVENSQNAVGLYPDQDPAKEVQVDESVLKSVENLSCLQAEAAPGVPGLDERKPNDNSDA